MEYKNSLCIGCYDKNSPYINKFGVYSPCLKCVNGNKYRENKRLTRIKEKNDESIQNNPRQRL